MSQMPTGEDLSAKIRSFIMNDKQLHTRVLLYEPIWLEDVFEQFKEAAKIKVKLAQVQS